MSGSETNHDNDWGGPAQAAILAILHATAAVQKRLASAVKGAGVTFAQFQLLRVLREAGGQPVAQHKLAKEFGVSFPTITGMLDRLERMDLIQRKRSGEDRREKHVELTAQATALFQRICEVYKREVEKALVHLTAEEQTEITRLLNKVLGQDVGE